MKTEFEELLTPEALEELRNVAFKVWPQTFKSILSAEQIAYMMEMMYAPNVLADELDKGYHFEILRIDNNSAGYISYSCCDDSPDTAKLHKVYLMHDFHGMGIGQKMLDHAQTQCRKLGFKNIMLCVNKHNDRAIKAYKRNGFDIDSAVCKSIGNGFVMDDYVMKKPL